MRQIRADMRSYYKLPHPQLKSYLKRQVLGSDAVYTTPFAGSLEDFWDSLEEWGSYLENALTDLPSLLEFEKDMAKKVGMMSVQKPLSARMQSIESYYSDILTNQIPIDPEAISTRFRQWGRPRSLKLISDAEVIEQMKKSTNSGSPYFTVRRTVIDRGLIGTVRRDGYTWNTVTPDGEFKCCATLGWRGQEGGPSANDVKQRDLWMFPLDLNIQEARVYVPLVKWGQRSGMIASWLGNDAVDSRITKLFDTTPQEDWIVCTDFTKFDQHFGRTMRAGSLDMLNLMFGSDPLFEYWKDEIYDAKYYIPICIAWQQFLVGEHGMASGSGGTNADETLGHSLLQTEAALHAGSTLNENSMCLGDDGVLTYPGINVDSVIDSYTSHGQVMNVDKQYVSHNDLVYLRRWHSRFYRMNSTCVGVYSTNRALGKLKFLERFHDPEVWGKEAVCTRSLSIIENCKYHPLREEFLDFCIKRDKFRLGIDIPGYLENFEKFVAKAVADRVLGYQYTDSFAPAPAKSWWVYKALKARMA